MAKKVTFEDKEDITYPLYVIRFDASGQWEDRWRPIQEHEGLDSVRDVIPEVTYDSFQKGLSGWSDPLLQELELRPDECFIKVADRLKQCDYRNDCIDYRPEECGPHLDFPVCFLAAVDADFTTQSLLTELFSYWDAGRWVCLVPYRRQQDFVE